MVSWRTGARTFPENSASRPRETASDLILLTIVLKVSHEMIVIPVRLLRTGAELKSDCAAAAASRYCDLRRGEASLV